MCFSLPIPHAHIYPSIHLNLTIPPYLLSFVPITSPSPFVSSPFTVSSFFRFQLRYMWRCPWESETTFPCGAMWSGNDTEASDWLLQPMATHVSPIHPSRNVPPVALTMICTFILHYYVIIIMMIIVLISDVTDHASLPEVRLGVLNNTTCLHLYSLSVFCILPDSGTGLESY